jgi:hypothetical protein
VLQVNDALHTLVGDGALRRNQLLALLRAAVEEAAVDLRMARPPAVLTLAHTTYLLSWQSPGSMLYVAL